MNFFAPIAGMFAEDPTLRMLQAGLILLGSLIVFLVLFTARDIILRTRSFLFQLFCIVLVAILPGIGFMIYLLIRPSRTLKERELFVMLQRIADMLPLMLPSEELDLEDNVDDLEGDADESGEEPEEPTDAPSTHES